MPIPYRCTTKDYKEASVANIVWGRLESRSQRLPVIVLRVGLFVWAAAICFFMFTGNEPGRASRLWVVESRQLIAADLAAPSLLAILTLLAIVKYSRTQSRPLGLVRENVPGSGRQVFTRTFYIWLGVWFTLYLIVRVLYAYFHYAAAAPAMPSGTVTPPAQQAVEDIDYLPFKDLFFLSFFTLVASLLLLVWAQGRLKMKVYTEGQPQLFRDQSLEFDGDGLTISSDLTQTRMKWAAIMRFVESKNLYLLYISKLYFHMIPKSALLATNDLDSFVAMLVDRVQEGVVLPHAGKGFPIQPVPVLPIESASSAQDSQAPG